MQDAGKAPLISVIVPVYNAAKTLRRSIESILSQTYTNIEIIAVNDGSKDNSLDILREYRDTDYRVKIIDKINGGVASARQAGIQNASGKYAIHVDPDDWIESNMLEQLYSAAIETNSDMIICDYYCEINNNINIINQKPSANDSRTVLFELFSHLHGSCCNKLISSNYYNKVTFTEGLNLSEDLLYICKILMFNPKIHYIDRAFYHYIIQPDTISQSKTYSIDRFCQLNSVITELRLLFEHNHELVRTVSNKMFPALSYLGLKIHNMPKELYISTIAPYRAEIKSSNLPLAVKFLILLSLHGHFGLAKYLYNMQKCIRN